jgi:hypothetical protein
MASLVLREQPVHYIGVQLTDDDVELVLSTIQERTPGVTHLTEALGIARTYLYAGLHHDSLELSKFLSLQHLIGLDLITQTHLKEATDQLHDHLASYLTPLSLD